MKKVILLLLAIGIFTTSGSILNAGEGQSHDCSYCYQPKSWDPGLGYQEFTDQSCFDTDGSFCGTVIGCTMGFLGCNPYDCFCGLVPN